MIQSTKNNRMVKLIISSFLFIILFSLSGCKEEKKELNLFNWRHYIGKNTISNFEKEFNVKVNIDYYASNEECKSKLSSNPNVYDLIIPSDYMVDIMINENMLEKINMSKLPNLKNIDPFFLGKNKGFDINDEFSVPYMWGSTGFAINKNVIKNPIKSWNSIFNDSTSYEISVLDDIRFTMGSILMELNKSPNTKEILDLELAQSFLQKNKKSIKLWSQDSPKEMLINGDISIAYAWSGDILQASIENPNIKYILPEKGTLIFQDGICIPKNAPNYETAMEFINYILRPEVSAEITNTIFYGNPNKEAKEFIEKDILNNKSIFPSKEYIKKCKRIKDIDEAIEDYNTVWKKIKS